MLCQRTRGKETKREARERRRRKRKIKINRKKGGERLNESKKMKQPLKFCKPIGIKVCHDCQSDNWWERRSGLYCFRLDG